MTSSSTATITSDTWPADQLAVFPMARIAPFGMPPAYAAMRDTGPVSRAVMPNGQRVWLINGHERVRSILVDPRVSSDRSHPNFPLPIAVTKKMREASQGFGRSLIGTDPPVHTDQRRMLITEFTVKKVQALRPRIQEIVDERIAAILAGPRPADLVRDLALPVPSLVICELLGVPYADRGFFQSRTRTLVSRSTSPEEREQANTELQEYFDQLVTTKEADPGDDLLGRLILHNRETQVFDHDRLAGLAGLLLVAGHETTANVISLGTAALLQHPDQLAALRADPELVPLAVEELLRFLSIVEAGFRVALADIEVGDVLIRAGEGLIALGGSANRDDAVFTDADTLDITRGARHHVAFGYGIHQCLGQNLARMELAAVFSTLFERVPSLRLAVPVDELPFRTDTTIFGLSGLPVTW